MSLSADLLGNRLWASLGASRGEFLVKLQMLECQGISRRSAKGPPRWENTLHLLRLLSAGDSRSPVSRMRVQVQFILMHRLCQYLARCFRPVLAFWVQVCSVRKIFLVSSTL